MELKRIADYKEFKIVLSRSGELGVEQFLLRVGIRKKIEEPVPVQENGAEVCGDRSNVWKVSSIPDHATL